MNCKLNNDQFGASCIKIDAVVPEIQTPAYSTVQSDIPQMYHFIY